MGGEVNININIAGLQGAERDLAKAADSDGSGRIDNAYEHSLFMQYCDAAGVDSSDYTAKYTAADTIKAEKQLIKGQKFSGSTKANAADLEQYEAVWQQAMKTAFESIGNDPQSRATLLAFIKTKPKLQNSTSMADYAFQLGQKITEMGQIVNKDLKGFATQLTEGAVERITNNTSQVAENAVSEINAHSDQNTASIIDAVVLTAEIISQQLEEGKAEVLQEMKDSEGRTAQLIRAEGNRVVKVVRNAAGQIINVVRQEGAATRAQVVASERNLHTHIAASTSNIVGTIYDSEYRLHEHIGNAEGRIHGHIQSSKNEIIVNDNRNAADIYNRVSEAEGNIIINGNRNNALTAHNEAITRNLNGDGRFFDTGHTQSTITAFNDMVNRINSSRLHFEEKNRLMQKLEDLSGDTYIFDSELDAMNDEISQAIEGTQPRSFNDRILEHSSRVVPENHPTPEQAPRKPRTKYYNV